MKLIWFVLLLLINNQISYQLDQEQLSSSQEQSQQCLFTGCRCDGDESTQNGPLIYEIVCDEQTGQFPERDTSKYYSSNLVSTLEIVSIGIKQVPDNQFNQLEIDLLDLSKNDITRLGSNVFSGIVRLEQLDLASNQLESIHSDTFKPLAFSLIQLNLGKNRLSTRGNYVFELGEALNKLKNLTVLTLVHNELAILPNLSRMTSLRDASFASNFITSLIDEQTNEPLLPMSLIELNLNENRLTHLTETMFANLKHLKYLSLESNQISSVSDYAFANSLMLSSINLCKNYLNQIPGKSFYYLNHLQRLDLSSQNQILRQIDNYAFDRQSNAQPIRRIDLSNNRIAKIDEKAFCSKNKSYPFINVKEIDLAVNPLVSLNACLVKQLVNGYKDPNQSQSKSKLSFRSNQADQMITDNLKCDCEITKSASLIDLEGECKNEDGNLVQLKQYKCADDLNDYNLDKYCSTSSYSCLNHLKDDLVTETKSFSTESSNEFEKFNTNRNMNKNNNNNNNNNNVNQQQTDQQNKPIKDNSLVATKLPASAIVNYSQKLQFNSSIIIIINSLLVVYFNLIKSSLFSISNLI